MSVGPSVRWSVNMSQKQAFEKHCFICVCGGVLRVDGGWMSLPTRPQRYCDPESLVTNTALTLLFFYTFDHPIHSFTQSFHQFLKLIRIHKKTLFAKKKKSKSKSKSKPIIHRGRIVLPLSHLKGVWIIDK